MGCTQIHRPSSTRKRADQPVSEGLGKTQGQVVRQTLHRVNRCLMGALEGNQALRAGMTRAVTLGDLLDLTSLTAYDVTHPYHGQSHD